MTPEKSVRYSIVYGKGSKRNDEIIYFTKSKEYENYFCFYIIEFLLVYQDIIGGR